MIKDINNTMTPKTKNILTVVAISVGLIGAFSIYYFTRKKEDIADSDSKSIIIGDSQTPFIANQSKQASLLGKVGGENSLWKGGMGVDWLKNAVSKYPTSKNIKSVIISIGTNGGFNKSDDIKGLTQQLKRAFPNAKLFVVQGSWGWGGNKGITTTSVKSYYDKFSAEGVKVISTPIGVVSDPHSNLPVYKEIGKNIDSSIT